MIKKTNTTPSGQRPGSGRGPRDQARIDRFNRLRDELIAQGYHPVEQTISVLRANLLAFATAGPPSLLLFLLFFRLHRAVISLTFALSDMLIACAVLILCIFVHELLHGFAWHFFCKSGWKSIHFGVIWSALTPYCACGEPLSAPAYLAGSLAPFCVLGIGFAAAALISGNYLVLILAVFNILAAGGDTTIALMLLRHRSALILDHPTACGFWAFERPSHASPAVQ